MTDRLFPLDEIPEVPLLREPRRAGVARGAALDARFLNDYPPEWHRCRRCQGRGMVMTFRADDPEGWASWAARHSDHTLEGEAIWHTESCGTRCLDDAPTEQCRDCLGMGSVKARVRFEAGHRCERCYHPYVPKGDAAMLGVEPSWQDGGWSTCDERCTHAGPVRWREAALGDAQEWSDPRELDGPHGPVARWDRHVRAQWRTLTVHHLRGDKASTSAWDLAVLCQRCHLTIQHKVVMERVYEHEHSEWFKWHAAGWYAFCYLGEDLTKAEILPRMDELLALELSVPA